MNNKGQSGPVTVIFIVLTFLIGWILVISKWLNDWGEQAIIINNLSGLEAFFYSNLNLLVGVCLVIFIIAYVRFSPE